MQGLSLERRFSSGIYDQYPELADSVLPEGAIDVGITAACISLSSAPRVKY
jgi:hypothetical protein